MRAVSIILFILITGPVVQAQNNFARTIKEYYRVSPFEGNFSAFVQALTGDSALLEKQILKQTDSTGYFVRGQYDVFNPYSINANKVDMIFYENAYKSRDRVLFNFYTYQLTAYFPDTDLTRQAMVKDYKKLVRKLKKNLYDTKRQSLKGYNNIEEGEITAFYEGNFPVETVLVSWQTLAKTKQLGLTIILRLVQENNYGYPISQKSALRIARP